MKKCKNCSKQKHHRKARDSHSPQNQIATEYGLAKIVSSPQIMLGNDEYMLEILFKTQKKTKKLDKEVTKIKTQIRNLQRSVEHARRNRSSRCSHVELKVQREDLLGSTQKAKSRLSSVNTSKNREIGRFTRVSEGESQSFSKHSFKQIIPSTFVTDSMVRSKQKNNASGVKGRNEDESETVSFSRMANNNYMVNSIKSKNKSQDKKEHKKERSKTKKDKVQTMPQQDNLLKYTKKQSSQISNSLNYSSQKSSNKKSPQKQPPTPSPIFLPSYQQVDSSLSSNLLSQEDSAELGDERARLQREFEELVVREKTVNEDDRKVIRGEIRALSKMLGGIKD